MSVIEVTPATFAELATKLDQGSPSEHSVELRLDGVVVKKIGVVMCPRCRSLDLRHTSLGYDCMTCALFFSADQIGSDMNRRTAR